MPEIAWKGNQHTNSSSRLGHTPICIVNHISAGSMGSMDNWFTSPTNQVSSAHFGVAKDGRIHQYVNIELMAWANGLRMDNLRAATAPIVFDKKVNPNLYSVSIEHEGMDGDLTEEQFQASVWLHRYIRDYVKEHWGYEIPFDSYHVIGHFQIDKINKPNCPGPKFPWGRLYETLKTEEDEDNMPMKLEEWQWDMLYKVMGEAYNADQLGWNWMQKIVDRTLTAAELAFLNTVLDGRIDRNIEV